MDNHRPGRPLTAVIAASVFMLGTGIGYRVLAAHLDAPVGANSIPASAVERFPLEIGVWKGEELPIDPNLVVATDTDAHISRQYSRGNGLEAVSLWVACGVRTRDLMPHRPEVCYTGNGWTLQGRRTIDLPISDGRVLPCNLIRFSRGALNTEGVVVLYYYVVDGQYCRDVAEWRYRLKGIGYVAQVQVVAPISAGLKADAAERLVSAFAADSAMPITALFADIRETPVPNGAANPTRGE